MKKFESFSANDTFNIAAQFAESLTSGAVVSLEGDLGAGKTAFTKGVAKAFGIDEGEVVSPTFTLVNEYMGRLPLYHFDAYRITSAQGFDTEWIDEYLFGDGVCLIEWAENLGDILPKDKLFTVKIEKNPQKGEDFREITIEG